MFEDLKKYTAILVTGPQRSGTRITAKMIAHDTEHLYIDEREIGIDSMYDLVSTLIYKMDKAENIVVHCPALCRYTHYFGEENDTTAVVMVWREISEIIASQERIKWPWEILELMRYEVTTGPIARVKYNYWQHYQRVKVTHPIDVKYEDLREHQLWIPAEKRQNFAYYQTELAR